MSQRGDGKKRLKKKGGKVFAGRDILSVLEGTFGELQGGANIF